MKIALFSYLQLNVIVSQANTVFWRERVMEVREGINSDGGLKSLGSTRFKSTVPTKTICVLFYKLSLPSFIAQFGHVFENIHQTSFM